MTHIKLEHIDNLRRGKRSGARVGSRSTPHHLYEYEEEKYKRALKNKYLEITTEERVNLRNLWEKVCIAKNWQEYILVKDTTIGMGKIFMGTLCLKEGTLKEMKSTIKNLINIGNI